MQFGKSIQDLQQEIDSPEFTRWQAYFSLEPDIGTRTDHLASCLAQLLANINVRLGGKAIEIQGKLIKWGE